MCSRLFSCPRAVRCILCFFLACMLVFCFIAPPYIQAYAVVDIILSGAISSTMSSLFALSGIKFANSSDLKSGIELAWSSFDDPLRQGISDFTKLHAPPTGSFDKPVTLPLPIDLMTSVIKNIYKAFPIDKTSVPGFSGTPVTKFLSSVLYSSYTSPSTTFQFTADLNLSATPTPYISFTSFSNSFPLVETSIIFSPSDYRNNFKFWGELLPSSDGKSTFYFSYSYTNLSGNYVEVPHVYNVVSYYTCDSDTKFVLGSSSLPGTGGGAVGAVYSPESYLIQSLFACDIELLRPVFKQYKYCEFVYDNGTRKFMRFFLYNGLSSPPIKTENNATFTSASCLVDLIDVNPKCWIDVWNEKPIFVDCNESHTASFAANSSFKVPSLSGRCLFHSFNYSWVHTTSAGLKQNEIITPVSIDTILEYSKTGKVLPLPSAPDVINPADLAYTADKSICVDGVLTKAIDDVLAKNPTKDVITVVVPADAADLVDGKLKDVVVDKELSDAIDKVIADTGSGTITGDITLPKVGEISLPNKITTVFPFSIPWDISRGLEVFKAEPVAPRFEIPFIVSGVIDTKVVLDFTRFDFLIRLLRWGELTLFIVGLAVFTRKVIRW